MLYRGIGYVAKWWTQGRDPLAPSTQNDPSPWRELTAKEYRSAKARGTKDRAGRSG